MKTVIFLNSGRYLFYDLGAIHRSDYRFVAIITQKTRDTFPVEQAQFVDQFYIVPNAAEHFGLVGFDIDMAAAENCVEKEISKAGGAQQVVIICSDEGNLALAGHLRDKFSIAGASYDEIVPYRNKLEMKKRIMAAHMAVPRFTVLDKQQYQHHTQRCFDNLVALLGLPFVVKPALGVGSLHTYVIHAFDEFVTFKDVLLSAEESLEAETFIDGTMYHCDTLIQNSKCLLTFCGEYSTGNLSLVLGSPVATMPLEYDDPLYKRLEKFSHDAIVALGQLDGSVHMEMFVKQNGDIVFLEAAARTPGGPIIPTYQRMYGINWLHLDFAIAVGERVNLPKPPAIKESYIGIIMPVSNKHCSFSGVIDCIQSDHETLMNAQALAPDYKATSVMDSSGFIFVHNQQRNILRQDFLKIKDLSQPI